MRFKKFDSMNVIPFIDIILVLLVIVMTFSTFVSERKIAINLPKSQTGEQNFETKHIDITIKSENEFYLDSKKLKLDKLINELTLLSKETQISIRANENTEFKNFVTIIDNLKKLELKNISIMTEIQK